MQNSYYENQSPPDALEQIFQGPLRWMNLIMILLNIGVYMAMEFLGSTTEIKDMIQWGAAYTPLILEGQWYRLITSMFLHFGFAHLFNNMVLLLFMGDILEEYVGKWKYLLIYLLGGIGGNLLSLIVEIYTGNMAVSAGASGAVFAVIGGVFVVILKWKGRIQEMTASRLFLMIILTIYYGFQSTGIDNAAHIGGVVSGILLTTFFYHRKSAS